MTNASESYNTENKTVLTSSQWLNLDDTVKELLIDMDYYGILGGKKLVTSSGETIITGIVDAVSDSGKLRDLETTLSNLNALFDEGNIVTQIRDIVKTTTIMKKDEKVKITDTEIMVVRGKSLNLDRRTALQKAYIDFLIENDVSIV
jgi:hypothetical protein